MHGREEGPRARFVRFPSGARESGLPLGARRRRAVTQRPPSPGTSRDLAAPLLLSLFPSPRFFLSFRPDIDCNNGRGHAGANMATDGGGACSPREGREVSAAPRAGEEGREERVTGSPMRLGLLAPRRHRPPGDAPARSGHPRRRPADILTAGVSSALEDDWEEEEEEVTRGPKFTRGLTTGCFGRCGDFFSGATSTRHRGAYISARQTRLHNRAFVSTVYTGRARASLSDFAGRKCYVASLIKRC